ncbi:sigma 54-interacting transcriptional regulator [Polyangium sp. y55x31]|uniref:sigma 54-interacting transcriptional regulator n=1 Tax=Polyangium sp. y55x31 TaxID=3042688 RepID=UPI0024826D0B|nr:sigma 54-interacting transcriptional regulator [Polyangium sp. y55x31]MDI1481719.1 sigma 54-interacting transcriptional regulator [Polyangium sp. y55x31]
MKDWNTWTMEADRGLELRTHKIRVEVSRGPMAGLVTEVLGPEVRVGSGKDCDLVLDDPTVSRHHLLLRIEGDLLRVLDTTSRNGTTVDGVRIRDAYARPDSTIGLGASGLKLQMMRDVVALPLSSRTRFGRLVGASVPMRRLFALLDRIVSAEKDTTVLVEGETGTGKELVAAALHAESARARGPFMVFDCSSVSAGMLESELFGHRRGSFTGATEHRVGRFEAAHGGTLFLDEIGELPLELQPKLLRALETRTITRIGENEPRRADVRIVAATNRSLAAEVERGRFREDLYYRLAVVLVRLPPLRERLDDIPLLVRHFEKEWQGRADAPPLLPNEVLERMKAHPRPWPGNVRELRNKVEMMLSLGLDEPPWAAEETEEPPSAVLPVVNLEQPLHVGLAQLESAYKRAYVERALRETGYNVSQAAKIAGVGRAFVQRVMRKHGIRSSDDAGGSEGGAAPLPAPAPAQAKPPGPGQGLYEWYRKHPLASPEARQWPEGLVPRNGTGSKRRDEGGR